MRVDNQAAFVLHSRDYRDSSLLVEFLTISQGRVSAVVKGVRGKGKTARQRRGIMQPFVPLLISWSGKTDLKQILHFEATGTPLVLAGQRLFSGFYVNELLVRLLQHYDESPAWFALYQQVMAGLQSQQAADIVLRRFELALLQELGYGLDLSTDAGDGRPLEAGKVYRFDAELGLLNTDAGDPAARVSAPLAPDQFRGEDLLALAQGEFSDAARRSAKRLCRLALLPHLGGKPLKSRELFY